MDNGSKSDADGDFCLAVYEYGVERVRSICALCLSRGQWMFGACTPDTVRCRIKRHSKVSTRGTEPISRG